MNGRSRRGPQAAARRTLTPSETQHQAGVLDAMQLRGWTAFHWPDSRRVTARGWPDLTMLHEATGTLAFVELKTDDGRLSPDQVRVLAALRRGGHPVYVWRPEDLRNGTVDRVLRTLRAPGLRQVDVELVDG